MNRISMRPFAIGITMIAFAVSSAKAKDTEMRKLFDAGPPEVQRLVPDLPPELGNGASLLMQANGHVQNALAIWLAQEPNFDKFKSNLLDAKKLYAEGEDLIGKVTAPGEIKLSETALSALVAKGYPDIQTSKQLLDELEKLARDAVTLISKIEGGDGNKADIGKLIEIGCHLDMFVGILAGAVAAVAA